MEDSIFVSEVNEKRRELKQLRSKSNGRRSSKHMFTYDYLSNKEKKEYTKGSEITVTNLFDEILSPEEYELLTPEQKKNAMTHWRNIHTSKAIREKFGWKEGRFYYELEKLGVERQNRKPRAAKAKKEGKAPAKTLLDHALELSQEIKQPSPQSTIELLPAPQGMAFYLNDTIKAEEAIQKLMKYAALLEGEKNKFKINLEIVEMKG